MDSQTCQVIPTVFYEFGIIIFLLFDTQRENLNQER